MQILAGDVGGTKTILRFVGESGDAVERRYDSAAYATFDALLDAFLSTIPERGAIDAACFAVAGPVIGGGAEITNLHWQIESEALSRSVPIAHVSLVNDFYAVALGVPLLHPDDLLSLNAGTRRKSEPIAILGAGTGLGEAMVTFARDAWSVVPSEGGHADFAPQDEQQSRLWLHLHQKYGHVSWERLLSGMGLVNIFTFLGGKGEDPAEIAKLADEGDSTALETMRIFVDVYGAETGNMAMRLLARGGVFLAGGIAAKNVRFFTDGRFLAAFLRKGRFQDLLRDIPVDLITNERVGLLGAEEMARRIGRP